MPTDNRKVILVVDDDESMTRVVKRLIEDKLEEEKLEERYKIMPENNPVQALAKIKEEIIDLALVISDIMMPEMDGLEFLKAVKVVYPDAPRIILTGYGDKQNAIEAINDIGLSYYLEKPWDDDFFGNLILNGLDQYRRAKMETMFGLYVPREIIGEFIDQSNHTILDGQTLNATILFLDFVDFTHRTQRMNAKDTVKLLNEYFSVMVDVITTYNGILDKFTGDGLMALFGVPKPAREPSTDATNAVLAAIDMVERVVKLRSKYGGKDLEPFRVRVGINTGEVLAGNIGCTNRLNYTVIGDAVNTASRIENIARDFIDNALSCILISQNTYEKVKSTMLGKATFKSQGLVQLKGKDEKLLLYKVSSL